MRENKSKSARRSQISSSVSKDKHELVLKFIRNQSNVKNNNACLLREPRILHRTLQCSILNGGVFCLSIFAFYGAVLPFIEALLTFGFSFGGQLSAAKWVWSWTSPVLSATFSALWILPLFVLSKFVNCFWFQVLFFIKYKSINK